MKTRIDPAVAAPQAPRALRTSASAEPPATEPPKGDAADGDPDDEEDEDDDQGDAIAEHEPVRAAAQQAHLDAAEAYGACKGTDSAAALMHAEDMGDAAGETHEAAKASSMKLRGAEPEKDAEHEPVPNPPPPPPRIPAASIARAIAAAASTGDAQAKLAAAVAFADRMAALFGGATLDATEGLVRAAHQDAAEAVKLRASAVLAKQVDEKRKVRDADAALRKKLSAAVRAGKYFRAEVFDVKAGPVVEGKPTEILTPKAWVRALPPATLEAMIAAKQARASGGETLPEDSPVHVSAGLEAYCKARGITDPAIKAKLAATLSTTAPLAPTEHA